MSGEPIVNLPNLYMNLLNVARTGNLTYTVQAGEARDSTNVYDIVNSVVLTGNMANVGVNGIDTGAIAASKLYNIYILADSRGFNPAATVISLTNPPIMPFGYDIYRLIGHLASDASSHLLAGYWHGNYNDRQWIYDAPQATAVTAGAATTYTAVDLTNLVPVVNNLPVMMAFAFTPGAASRTLKLQGLNSTGDAVTITGQVTAVVMSNNVGVYAQTSTAPVKPEINYKVSNAGDAVALNVAGYSVSL